MQAVQDVWLYDNQFSGALPTFDNNPGTLLTLQQLYLNDNLFTGTLIKILTDAPTTIEFLGLGGNPNLGGTISRFLARITSLHVFNVSYTSVTGTLPNQLAMTTSLST